MAWEHLSITKPHLVYIILGGFTSLFMLCSSVIKERLYIGEATVATICGIIFGPHAANLINPLDWGNTDLITLEFARIVLVVQCFAVGVELPRAYMERHWKSVTFLLVPVMTFGWLVTSLFIWGLFNAHLNWLDSLCVAACVTATDPVLASSVVGKGKFAKRVPKHLRDLLSAESGCNDGMAFPFIYLAIYIIRYHHHPNEVALHWFCYTILYECIFGCVYGVTVGYAARRAIRWAHEKDVIDRESFLVFYFVLALFCAGSGSLLGMDDLLVGFACGVGFSNDGWFLEKTEESHVSNVIDLLINLAFFVYFGTIIPWAQFNASVLGLDAWRLVCLGLLVLFFRRIPIMMILKPVIPDIKTWREALFAGHFGPIGVGAIFVAILARAELETESTTPLAELPTEPFEYDNIVELIWPITTFLVITSILVHGSSIAVFTLGKHINTLSISMSYTKGAEDVGWMDRLPRIQSRSRSQMSGRKGDDTEASSMVDEKLESGFPLGVEPPTGWAGGFLRRQKEEDPGSRSSSAKPTQRRRKWDQGLGPGGPISQSAIGPAPRPRDRENRDHSDVPGSPLRDSSTLNVPSDESPTGSMEKEKQGARMPEEEIYEEGPDTVYEDEEGNVLEVEKGREGQSDEARHKHERKEGRRLMGDKDVEQGVAQTEDDERVDEGEKVMQGLQDVMHDPKDTLEHPQRHWRDVGKKLRLKRQHEGGEEPKRPQKAETKRGPALAYQYGNTIIVEDEDGEVIKKYDIPSGSKGPGAKSSGANESGAPQRPKLAHQSSVMGGTRQRLTRMGTMLGMGQGQAQEAATSGPSSAAPEQKKKPTASEDQDDDNLRFTMTAGGRRMSKAEFIQQIQSLDPKARAAFAENSDAPESVKKEAKKDAKEEQARRDSRATRSNPAQGASTAPQVPAVPEDEPLEPEGGNHDDGDADAAVHKVGSNESRAAGPEGLTLIDSNEQDIPFHSLAEDLSRYRGSGSSNTANETPAQRRRRLAAESARGNGGPSTSTSPHVLSPEHGGPAKPVHSNLEEEETPAERRRRLGIRFDPEHSQSPQARGRPRAATQTSSLDEGETAAERRRREGALGRGGDDSDDEEEEGEEGPGTRRIPATQRGRQGAGGNGGSSTPGIRFADTPSIGHVRGQGAEAEAARGQGGFFGSGNASGGSAPTRESGDAEGGPRRRMLRWGTDVGRKMTGK